MLKCSTFRLSSVFMLYNFSCASFIISCHSECAFDCSPLELFFLLFLFTYTFLRRLLALPSKVPLLPPPSSHFASLRHPTYFFFKFSFPSLCSSSDLFHTSFSSIVLNLYPHLALLRPFSIPTLPVSLLLFKPLAWLLFNLKFLQICSYSLSL